MSKKIRSEYKIRMLVLLSVCLTLTGCINTALYHYDNALFGATWTEETHGITFTVGENEGEIGPEIYQGVVTVNGEEERITVAFCFGPAPWFKILPYDEEYSHYSDETDPDKLIMFGSYDQHGDRLVLEPQDWDKTRFGDEIEKKLIFTRSESAASTAN